MKEKDFDVLAGYIADAVIRNKPVKDEVRKYREGFLEMLYCLPAKDALPAAARVFASIFGEVEIKKK